MTVCGIVVILKRKKTQETFGVSVVTLLYRFSLISSLVFTVIAGLLGVFILSFHIHIALCNKDKKKMNIIAGPL